MKHLKKGRKFGRKRGARKALLRNLLFQLIMHERLTTTEAKAKELRPAIEKLVTAAKKGTLASRRKISAKLPGRAAEKLFKVIAPRLIDRRGGYTRIIKFLPRKSDSSRMAMIELVQ